MKSTIVSNSGCDIVINKKLSTQVDISEGDKLIVVRSLIFRNIRRYFSEKFKLSFGVYQSRTYYNEHSGSGVYSILYEYGTGAPVTRLISVNVTYSEGALKVANNLGLANLEDLGMLTTLREYLEGLEKVIKSRLQFVESNEDTNKKLDTLIRDRITHLSKSLKAEVTVELF